VPNTAAKAVRIGPLPDTPLNAALREDLIDYIRKHHPAALPRLRAEVDPAK
jgi:hypothetical protein